MCACVVHWASLNETDRLLRTFDLDYKFGPCVGIKRIERWGKYDINTSSVKKNDVFPFLERAYALGLNPSKEIRTILLRYKTEYQESLFDEFKMI